MRTRLIAAALALATAGAGAGAVTASAAPASPSAPAPKGDPKPGPGKDDVIAKVAASLHVTVRQLVTAIDHLKQAVGNGTPKDQAVAAFARELKISVADAEQALSALSALSRKPGDGKEKPKPGIPEEAAKLLAAELHVSVDQANRALQDLENVKANGDEVVKDPAFVAIAARLHVTPQRLLAALIAVKKQLVGKEKEPEKAPSGSPTK